MLRHNVPVRRDLDRIAADNGFDFHIIDNEIYWDESRAYRFNLRQIEEQIEKPTAELHQMCLEVVDRAVKDEEILTQLAIPPLYWDVIAESWRARDPSLYGRMDFAWCGNAPVKLLEYNADTPTSLYESAYFQWLWLEDARRSGVIPRDADQYNAIQERLISRFSELYSREPFYFCCCQDTDEDRSTVLYLQDCAEQAGQESRFIYIEELGLGVGGVLTDLDDNVIQRAYKLYPLEWMMRDDNGPLLRKVYIPKYIFPLEKCCFALVNFFFSLVALFIVALLTWSHISIGTVLLAIYPLVMLFIFSLGIGLILSTLYVFVRDIMHIWEVFCTLLVYGSAIFYDPRQMESWMQYIINLNPIYWYITSVRSCVMWGEGLTPNMVLIPFLCAALSLGLGVCVFKKNQDKFVLYM